MHQGLQMSKIFCTFAVEFMPLSPWRFSPFGGDNLVEKRTKCPKNVLEKRTKWPKKVLEKRTKL